MDAQEVYQITPDNLPAELLKMTLDEFLESDLEGYEDIKEELFPMAYTPLEHGYISANLSSLLHFYVRENHLGRVLISNTGFRVGECVLIPDIAFISTDHIPSDSSKASSVPPDLAAEVVSQTDTIGQIDDKVFAYLEAGTQLVWLLSPTSKTVTVYRSETEITTLTRNDTLSGKEVVKGFSCQVAEFFE